MYHKDSRISKLYANKRTYLNEQNKKLDVLSICIKSMRELAEKFGIEIASKQIKDTFNYKWYDKEYTDIPREYRMYYIIGE